MTSALSRTLVDRSWSAQELIDDQLRARLVARIAREHGVDSPYAMRIVDQALGFLRLCAERPGQGYAPAPEVDLGWHTFILYTAEYADFCQRVAGRFIHHSPNDEPGRPKDVTSVPRTVKALRSRGFVVDEQLWRVGFGEGAHCDDDDCRNGR